MASDVISGLGTKKDFIATVPNLDTRRLALTDDETMLLALVGRATPIEEVISRCGMSEPLAIAGLLSLRVKGAIVPAKVQKTAASNFDAALLEEIDLDETRKKEILEFEARLVGANFFQVLGVDNLASPEEAKRAFYELSRKFHPDRFFGKNLGSFRSRVEKSFKKITEAHHALGDIARRTAYLSAHPELIDKPVAQATTGSDAAPAEPIKQRTAEDDAREAERRARLTRHPYLAKTSKVNDLVKHARDCIARGEVSLAFNDLTLASQIDDRNPEVKLLLVEVRKKHDLNRAENDYKKGLELLNAGDRQQAMVAFRASASVDSTHAGASYNLARMIWASRGDLKEANLFAQRAVEGDPRNIEYRELYGTILEQAGMKALAKKQFEVLLKLDPSNAVAKKQLKRRWPF